MTQLETLELLVKTQAEQNRRQVHIPAILTPIPDDVDPT